MNVIQDVHDSFSVQFEPYLDEVIFGTAFLGFRFPGVRCEWVLISQSPNHGQQHSELIVLYHGHHCYEAPLRTGTKAKVARRRPSVVSHCHLARHKGGHGAPCPRPRPPGYRWPQEVHWRQMDQSPGCAVAPQAV